ncbi:response regulator transcription factor [Saccharopolyspora elongata]|uniref:Response regulator transcription factor n=1 Tax=Saccharopolyspora elongata TaxID=2530387 RepID=A0A4R4Y616_9PSEU|nr:response regulator transcription factor [Saccharopolyspora elongata]
MLRSLSLVNFVHGCADFREAVTLLENRPFDVALISADELAEFEQISSVAAKRGVKTVALLRDASDDVVAQAATLSADGFLLESAVDPQNLEDALLRLQRGDMALPSSLARKLITELRRRGQPRTSTVRLTPRERQVLGLLAEGMSNKQVGRRLGISAHGAKRHVANLLAKLNCPNRTLAVAYAIRDGLLTS